MKCNACNSVLQAVSTVFGEVFECVACGKAYFEHEVEHKQDIINMSIDKWLNELHHLKEYSIQRNTRNYHNNKDTWEWLFTPGSWEFAMTYTEASQYMRNHRYNSFRMVKFCKYPTIEGNLLIQEVVHLDI